ncbi:hypothetical protein C0995_015539 [Termitomyces sp. Mi166|nr:hypothetical protein C0995_015539 [Termitomyces sp. Mi166\
MLDRLVPTRASPTVSVDMQRATCTGIRIRSPADARVIFHAVLLNILPMVTRRLDNEERGLITPGSVYVWEERGPHAELTGVGIERWTDVAYFTEESIEHLLSIDDIPPLANLVVPSGKYKSARSTKGRPDHIFNNDTEAPEFPRLEYIPYTPKRASASPSHTADALYHSHSEKQIEPLSQTRYETSSKSRFVSSDEPPPDSLAPLEYLQNMAPPRRHPTDEKALQQLHYSRLLL